VIHAGTGGPRRRFECRRRRVEGAPRRRSVPALHEAVPFGGYQQSGRGREMGQRSLDEYLDVKSVWINAD
jgi:acyl-CoA reductase-like NAD-dependent aldehyde dehydrogenase